MEALQMWANITPKTFPVPLLDQLTHLSVNRLFTARSTKQFHLELTGRDRIASQGSERGASTTTESAQAKRDWNWSRSELHPVDVGSDKKTS